MRSRAGQVWLLALATVLPRLPASAAPGSDWVEVTPPDSAWNSEYLAAVSYQEKLWVIGNGRVSSTEDGISWTLAGDKIPEAGRHFHSVLVFNDKMWILGDHDGDWHANSVAYSVDGSNWTTAVDSSPFGVRRNSATVVYNDKMWLLGGWDGGSAYGDVWSSVNGSSWTLATASAPWAPRFSCGGVVHDDKMWIIGGGTGLDPLGDVWYSSDGTSWTLATDSAPWGPRFGHSSVVHNGKMWVIGGDGENERFNDVWYSEDGSSWTLVTANAGWAPVAGHNSVVHNGKIWMLHNEVWCSEDGANWTQTAPAARWWDERHSHASVYFDNKIWVMGGSPASNDAWSSPDGQSWTLVTPRAEWGDRFGHAAVVHDGKMWIMGGTATDFGELFNDAWWSEDGRHWTSATLSAEWAPRYHHAAVSFNGEIWVLGGHDLVDHLRDVWASEDGTSWTYRFSINNAPAAAVHNGVLWMLDYLVEFSNWHAYDVPQVLGFDGVDWHIPSEDLPFLGRTGTALVSWQGKMWLIGGGWNAYGVEGDVYGMSDIWSSADGNRWTLETNAPFAGRYEHTAVATPERLYILGGSPWGVRRQPFFPMNDIWYTNITPPASVWSWPRYR